MLLVAQRLVLLEEPYNLALYIEGVGFDIIELL
jgi:hypothetical protein